MMKALGVVQYGNSDKIEILEIPRPEITGPNDIIVRVKAIAVNVADGIKVAGYHRLLETVKLPVILGHDYAGIVEAIGAAITKFEPGDLVYGMTSVGGAAAQYMIFSVPSPTHKYTIQKMPLKASFAEAASIPIAAHTAIEALRRAEDEIPGGLKGKTVFIPAGLGGVGSIAVQLAKNVFDARKVITTVSTAKVALVSELLGEGVVDQVIDYKTQDVVKEIGSGTVDFMLDTSLTSMSYLATVNAKAGVIFTITGKSGKTLEKDYPATPWVVKRILDVLDGWFRWRAWRWGVAYDHVYVPLRTEQLIDFAEWFDNGKVRAVVGRTETMLDIEKVREMFKIVASGKGGVGRYVIEIN